MATVATIATIVAIVAMVALNRRKSADKLDSGELEIGNTSSNDLKTEATNPVSHPSPCALPDSLNTADEL
jgi:hypothetical protein